MNKVQIKADTTTKTAGSSTVTTKAVLKLSNLAAGTSSVTPKAQNASIEFEEGGTVLATLKGTIEERSGQPVFKFTGFMDLKPATTDLEESDFVLPLGVGVGFEDDALPPQPNSAISLTLRLPWRMTSATDVMKIKFRLKVGNTIETDVGDNATVDVPLQQKGVNFTGHPKMDYFGSITVYPVESEHFKSNSTVKIGSDALNVWFDSSSFTTIRKIDQRNISFAGFEPLLKKILSDAGFASINITTNAGPATWFRDTGGKMGPPAGQAAVETPVFDFYVYSEQGTTASGSTGGESGRSETHATPKFDITKRIKRLKTPTVMVTDPGGTLEKNLQKAMTSANEMLANIVAHEIGHALGLLHPLSFAGGKHALVQAKGTESFTVHLDARKDHLMFFGPVHKKTIKDLFL